MINFIKSVSYKLLKRNAFLLGVSRKILSELKLLTYRSVMLKPHQLLTENRRDLTLRVECLNKILKEGIPPEKTLYYHFSADQDKGMIENPSLSVSALLNCCNKYPVNTELPSRKIVVFPIDPCNENLQIADGEDYLAVALFQKRSWIPCLLMKYDPLHAIADYTELIIAKNEHYIVLCENIELRELLNKIRSINYGTIYLNETKFDEFTTDMTGRSRSLGLKNFHKGARVVSKSRNFYQGLEDIGIIGERPSEIRFNEYGLKSFISGKEQVLDLGCNVGFFSLLLAKYTAFVRGIDANNDLVKIGNVVKDFLGIENCELLCQFFEQLDDRNKYDLIFSGNLHYYIDMNLSVYLKRICAMLNPRGMILIETATPLEPKANPKDIESLNNFEIPEVEALVNNGQFRVLRKGLSFGNSVRIRFFYLLQMEADV